MAKATRKQALGRGLSALLKDPENDIQSASDKNADKVVGSIVELDIEAIEMNPFQPRLHFNDESLQELATSIRELGVIQPITVRKLEFNKFQLVSGERRYRASKLIGLATIPATIEKEGFCVRILGMSLCLIAIFQVEQQEELGRISNMSFWMISTLGLKN